MLVSSRYFSVAAENIGKTLLSLLVWQNIWKNQPGAGILWLTVSEVPVCPPWLTVSEAPVCLPRFTVSEAPDCPSWLYWFLICYKKIHLGIITLWRKLITSRQTETWRNDWKSAVNAKGMSLVSFWKPLVRIKHPAHEPVRTVSLSN